MKIQLPRALLVSLLLLLLLPLPLLAAQAGKEARQAFLALHAKGDHAGLVELWRKHPGAALTAIDADLEGSLALRERSTTPDEAAIAALHARALAGARAASEALANPIFLDYTTAFVGWSKEEQATFRAGQAAHGRARKARKDGDFAASQKAARECADLAGQLGDWWGLAMGLAAEGEAFAALGEPARAIAPLAYARQIYHDLRLEASEYPCIRALAKALEDIGRPHRALACARDAAAMAVRAGDAAGRLALLEQIARLERASGDEQAALATEEALSRLRKP